MITTVPTPTLVAASLLVPGRFAGRAALERRARDGDPQAQRDLAGRVGLLPPIEEDMPLAEALVGLGQSIASALARLQGRRAAERRAADQIDMVCRRWEWGEPGRLAVAYWVAATPRERSRALAQWTRDSECARRTGWRPGRPVDLPSLATALAEHHSIARRPSPPRDLLAERCPGQAAELYRAAKRALVERLLAEFGPLLRAACLAQEVSRRGATVQAVEQAVMAAYRAAGLRRAAHAHEITVRVVACGEERASSDSGSVDASKAGLSKAYCRQAYRVATSAHTLHASVMILDPEVVALNKGAPRGALYLRADLRVVQSRGTALRVERATPKGGWR